MTEKTPAVSRMKHENLRGPRISKSRLDEMIEQATVDCNNESEQMTGWFTLLDENLAAVLRKYSIS
jgi:hypothetical protein